MQCKRTWLVRSTWQFLSYFYLYIFFIKNPLKRWSEEEAFLFSSFHLSWFFSSLPLFLPFSVRLQLHFPFPWWYNISILKKGMKDAYAWLDLNQNLFVSFFSCYQISINILEGIYIIKTYNYNRNKILCTVKAHFTSVLGKKIKATNMGGGGKYQRSRNSIHPCKIVFHNA